MSFLRALARGLRHLAWLVMSREHSEVPLEYPLSYPVPVPGHYPKTARLACGIVRRGLV